MFYSRKDLHALKRFHGKRHILTRPYERICLYKDICLRYTVYGYRLADGMAWHTMDRVHPWSCHLESLRARARARTLISLSRAFARTAVDGTRTRSTFRGSYAMYGCTSRAASLVAARAPSKLQIRKLQIANSAERIFLFRYLPLHLHRKKANARQNRKPHRMRTILILGACLVSRSGLYVTHVSRPPPECTRSK
jgi:hypothetical protein